MMKPSYERIKFLQNQLRTAIQNHHVLLVKSRLSPQDTEIRNQMNILQSLIISMGRTQNDLLEQLENELENNLVARAEVGRYLYWNIPKNVPLFKGKIKSDGVKSDENAPVLLTKACLIKQNPRVYSRGIHSLLKPIKTKGSNDLKNDNNNLSATWKNPRNLQSVLKPKANNQTVKGFIRLQSDTTKICGDNVNEEQAGDDGSTSPKRRKVGDSEPNSRSSSVSPKPVSAPKPELTRRKVVESKLWTRGKRRLAVEAAAAAAKAASFSGNSEKDINELEAMIKNEPIDPSIPIDEKILKNIEVYEKMGKIKFLESLGLISLSERDSIRAKKGGRKRRTAAGQSNFYNDYFQHSALSMKNPKWRHEMQPLRRAPKDSNKKNSILEGTRQGDSPPEIVTSGEVTPEEKASPPRDSPPPDTDACVGLSGSKEVSKTGDEKDIAALVKTEEETDVAADHHSQNSIVVEAPDEEEDDEKDKEKLCIFCRAPGDEATLEICTVCGENYHTACVSSESEGRCTLCSAQISGFKAIMGGEAGVSSSSSLEVIKRYLPS